jgi:acetyl-CoA carboxylase carboxyltransferase component
MSALKTHPKQWLERLLDGGSEFVQLTAALDEGAPAPGDEVVTGIGQIHGKKVCVVAHNNLVDNGYLSSSGSRKILRMMNLAEETGLPIVSLYASPGVSIREGLLAGDAYAQVLRRTCELSGILPQICGIMAVNVGGPAYSATLQDITVFNRTRSHMMISAPNVVKSVLGEDATLSDLGGVKVHSETTGLAHFVEDSVPLQIARIRELVRFLPSHHLEDPARRTASEPSNREFKLPTELSKSYRMMDVINAITDGGIVHEYNSSYGTSIQTLWTYIDGRAVGILANNPEVLAGSLNVESSEKSARFIRLCDAYNIPVITFIDTPGFMPGKREEQAGLLKSGARLCRSMQTRVPRVSVILRKNYGAAAIVLTQTRGWGGDLVLALDSSSCAIMGFSSARQALYGVEDLSDEQLAKYQSDYKRDHEDPQNAYQKGFVDQITTFDELRDSLVAHLEVLSLKRDKKISPVRGIEP